MLGSRARNINRRKHNAAKLRLSQNGITGLLVFVYFWVSPPLGSILDRQAGMAHGSWHMIQGLYRQT